MTVQIPKSIRDNLRFLGVEVDSQVASLQDYVNAPSTDLARRILNRSGYANNLKMRIHTSCMELFSASKNNDSTDTLSLRSVEIVATELERITELCRDCIKQMEHLTGVRYAQSKTYTQMLSRVRRGITLVGPAIEENDTQLALKIGQIEAKLDQDYNRLLNLCIKSLKQTEKTEELICGLFVAHSIEQMGDVLLNICESILSSNLGQAVNLERYHSLQESVERLDIDDDLADIQVERIAQTRSGSAISGISAADSPDGAYVAIFKDGEKRKLKEEREGVESWHDIYPGLAPKILSYKKRGQSAALLIEHLPGFTFEQILLRESPALLQETLEQLGKTLKSVWRETRSKKTVSANFMQQLDKRLGDVYKIHPEFKQSCSDICGHDIPSFDTLVKQAGKYEKNLQAPFSVYIHGDFNLDNIIYDPLEQRINFIDLHRSCYSDYIQDISVFMVSNYRLQILDAPLRRRIMEVAKDFYRISARYAHKSGDETFELRLALGLARSFASSTRFILDKSLARSMFLRARYLIEQVLATDPKKAGNFKVPVKEIFVG